MPRQARPVISPEKGKALAKAITYALEHDPALFEHERKYCVAFVTQLGEIALLRDLLDRIKPAPLEDKPELSQENWELIQRQTRLSEEQRHIREAEQQVKRILPAESKPDINRDDTQNRDTD